MILFFRLATLVYILTVITAGYLAFTTVGKMWDQARQLNELSSAYSLTLLDPAAGGN